MKLGDVEKFSEPGKRSDHFAFLAFIQESSDPPVTDEQIAAATECWAALQHVVTAINRDNAELLFNQMVVLRKEDTLSAISTLILNRYFERLQVPYRAVHQLPVVRATHPCPNDVAVCRALTGNELPTHAPLHFEWSMKTAGPDSKICEMLSYGHGLLLRPQVSSPCALFYCHADLAGLTVFGFCRRYSEKRERHIRYCRLVSAAWEEERKIVNILSALISSLHRVSQRVPFDRPRAPLPLETLDAWKVTSLGGKKVLTDLDGVLKIYHHTADQEQHAGKQPWEIEKEFSRRPNLEAIIVAWGEEVRDQIVLTEVQGVQILRYPFLAGGHSPMHLLQFASLCNQLANLHENLILHGDIRLANFIFSSSVQRIAHLIDFDYARRVDTVPAPRYPIGYNYDVRERSPGACECVPMVPRDDRFSLAKVIAAMVEGEMAETILEQIRGPEEGRLREHIASNFPFDTECCSDLVEATRASALRLREAARMIENGVRGCKFVLHARNRILFPLGLECSS